MSSPTSDAAPLRILHVAEFLQGGIATYLNELLPAQQERYGSANVTLIAPRSHAPFLSPDVGCTLELYDRSHRDPGSLWRLRRTLGRVVRATRPDIVHLHSTFAGGIGRVAIGRRADRPTIVYCAHGWAFLRDAGRAATALATLTERRLAGRCDALVSISDTEHAAALGRGLPAQLCHTIRYGISDIAVDPRVDRVEHDPLRLLFIGRHDTQKGLDVLLDGFARLDPARFRLSIAGAPALTGSGSGRADPTPTAIDWLGWLSPAEVNAALARHDVLVVPSRWEGFGFVALEAMRSATPVVASRRGSLPEVIGSDGAGWIFEPLDAAALARQLDGLDARRVREAGRRARERYGSLFRAERMIAETDVLYGDLLRARRSETAGTPAQRSPARSER